MIFTIGHSTRTNAEVHNLLLENNVTALVDVRSYPSSQYCPQWNQVEIIRSLPDWLTYCWMGETLGGKRKGVECSENGAWRNASFRGFADYMQTPEFHEGLEDLMFWGERENVAIMCAEAVWWRCHRSLIADALVAHAVPALHIMGSNFVSDHALRDFAVVSSKHRVTYPKVSR